MKQTGCVTALGYSKPIYSSWIPQPTYAHNYLGVKWSFTWGRVMKPLLLASELCRLCAKLKSLITSCWSTLMTLKSTIPRLSEPWSALELIFNSLGNYGTRLRMSICNLLKMLDD